MVVARIKILQKISKYHSPEQIDDSPLLLQSKSLCKD